MNSIVRNIAITGGAGGGKTTMIQFLKKEFRHTANFFSMDEMMDDLYHDNAWLQWLKDNFGSCDRQDISRFAFEDRNVMDQLVLRSSFPIGIKMGKALSNPDGRLQFFEVPLLFESGIQNEFDLVVLITASTSIRAARVAARGFKTVDEAYKVIQSQIPDVTKEIMSEIVIDTSDDNLPRHITELIHALKERI